MTDAVTPKSIGRLTRTVRSLITIVVLGAALIVWSSFTSKRDIDVATGPKGPSQHQFMIDAAERPDVATFFKKLSHAQRMAMSRNIGAYDDAPLAKLCALLLADFDAEARDVLAKSLGRVARKHPDAVAEQMKLKGSFQVLGVNQALREAGPSAIPFVVKQFTVGDARSNAIAYLVDSGPLAVPSILPSLEDSSADVRQAAADALGKLRAHEAVAPLVAHYQSSTGEEKLGYLTALAAIGDASTEDLMKSALGDQGLPTPQRSQAALGLGRIATPTSIAFLWKYGASLDAQIAANAMTGLQLSKDLALQDTSQPALLRLKVATGVDSALADSVIAEGLSRPNLLAAAAEAAKGRDKLVGALLKAIGITSGDRQGDVADALIAALMTTSEGKAAMPWLSKRKDLVGFIQRRERLTAG